jgi:hypothetical protein
MDAALRVCLSVSLIAVVHVGYAFNASHPKQQQKQHKHQDSQPQ